MVIVILVAAGLYFGRNNSGNKITDSEFIEPGQTGRLMVLDLSSTGCIPCQMMAPILEELVMKYQGKGMSNEHNHNEQGYEYKVNEKLF